MEDNQINRLGFDAWADNKFVNAIEDYVFDSHGSMHLSSISWEMNLWWSHNTIDCSIRAYTKDGWQTYEKQIKR